MPTDPLTHVRALVQSFVPDEVDQIEPDEDLRDYGLDSIRLMDLLTELRGLGHPVELEELAGEPTLAALAHVVSRTTA